VRFNKPNGNNNLNNDAHDSTSSYSESLYSDWQPSFEFRVISNLQQSKLNHANVADESRVWAGFF